MRVAHQGDYDTHAIIGGDDVQEFGIAQTAEFFTVLSNTLYSNKPLAVIRELLCNAWDSHIVSGCTDVAVKVTITDDELIIRDFGNGIPHHLIHQIYCIYGNSTKENDGKQTGGFGLGSKSPFAYSDHFTVNNYHDGIKAINAISRGSALTAGKPDRRVLHKVPTTETGVEVIIPVKSNADKRQFIEITQDIAAFGEMKVELNGREIEMVPISTAEGNMFITNRTPRGSFAKINVRYGNVVYPVQPESEYIGLYNELRKIMDSLPSVGGYNTNNDLVIILQAPPHSISVTPSRESLSNTETTINTLKGLFTDIISYMELGSELFQKLLLDEQAKTINAMWANGTQDRIMFLSNLAYADMEGDAQKGWITINSLPKLADYYLRNTPRLSAQMKHKMRVERLKMQIEKGYRHSHKLKMYLKHLIDKKSEWDFSKNIIRPLIRHIAKHPELNWQSLYLVKPTYHNARFNWSNPLKLRINDDDTLPLLQGVVIVTHNKLAYEQDWDRITDKADLIPNNQLRMVYVAPRTKGHKEAAVALFTKLGYEVVDFATMLDEYREKTTKITKPAVALTARVKKTGLVLLSEAIKRGSFDIDAHLRENAPRSEKFDYVIRYHQMTQRDYRGRMAFPWGRTYQEEIVRLFGSNIGICVNEAQYAAQIKKGKKDGLAYIAQSIANEVLTNPLIRRYVEEENRIKFKNSDAEYLVEIAKHSTIIKQHLNLPDPVPKFKEKIYYSLFEFLVGKSTYGAGHGPNAWDHIIWSANQEMKKWKVCAAYLILEERIEDSTGINLLDLYQMMNTFRELDPVNPNYMKKVFMETAIINALAF